MPLRTWLREGLRAGFFLKPRIGGHTPGPLQVAMIVLIVSMLEVALSRFEVAGPASFDLRAWLAPWWSSAAVVLLAWWALPAAARAPAPGAERPAGLAAWIALWLMAVLPAGVVSHLLGIAQAYEALPAVIDASAWVAWSLYFALWAWTVGAVLRLSAHFGVSRSRMGALALGLVALLAVTAWQFPERPWEDVSESQEQEEPQVQLSQEVFEAQQAVWQQRVDALAPQRPGVTDVYALVFSPYADGDVFLRESSMVATLLAERFDAQGRVLHLVNHPSTFETHPWATRLNMERAIAALGARMDREHDVLVVYLTSHGAQDFRLAASNGPLDVEPVSPGELRSALDKAGIRNRVVVVSACYSGGWVGPLASDDTLVMTAADADHTSYGCGQRSELTFFGRAVFAEALRTTHSFEQAFAAAVPVIRRREDEAGKDDGFSNPQISVGARIRPVLRALEQRLDDQRKQP